MDDLINSSQSFHEDKLTAFIINPDSEVARYMIGLLLENDVTVTVKATQELINILPSDWQNHPRINFLISSDKTIPDKNYRYFIAFVSDPTEILRSVISHTTSKSMIVFPATLDVERIKKYVVNTTHRLAAVSPGIGENMDLADDSFTTQVFQSVCKEKPLEISSNQDTLIYIASIKELAEKLLEILFTSSPGTINWLVPKPISLKSFSEFVSKLGYPAPRFSITEKHRKFENNIRLPSGISYWSPIIPPDQTIVATLKWLSTLPRISTTEISSITAPVKKLTLSLRPLLSFRLFTPASSTQSQHSLKTLIPIGILVAVCSFFATLVLLVVVYFSIIFHQTTKAISLTTSGNFAAAYQISAKTYRQLVIFDQILIVVKSFFRFPLISGIHQNLVRQIATLETFSYSALTLTRLAETATQLVNSGGVPDYLSISPDIETAEEALTLSLLENSSRNLSSENLPFVGQSLTKFQKYAPDLRNILLYTQKLLPLISRVGGYDRQKVYLLLFQNNMELRPTGGFIGSFGLATLKDGKLVDLTIRDVYSADGQLKGHVEPPAPIKNVLKEANWFFRDSNWDPDFPTSAVRAQWFLEKEIGQTVDGTIGITLNLAQKLLKITGSITLSDYAEEINADNLYLRAQYHAEANFFPGSTGKQDFLSSLARALLVKLRNPTPSEAIQIFKALRVAAAEKDIQVYLADPELESRISTLDLTGNVKPYQPCPQVYCVSDDLLIVDSNLGVNKDNYFLKKSYLSDVSVTSEGEIQHRLIGSFQNTAATDTWPAGIYRSYLRLYLPPGTQISSVSLRNPADSTQTDITAIDTLVEHGRQIFGFTFEVPIKEARELTILYSIPFRLDLAQKGTYLFDWQKQAGTIDEPITLSFKPPENVKVTSVFPALPQNQPFDKTNTIRYNLRLSQDQSWQVSFAPVQ
jgi:hypothetical protein